MGRVKQSRPIKRRRVILEADDSVVAEEQTTLMEHQNLLLQENQGEVGGEEELATAIELLRKTPPDQVEAAAAAATRLDLARNDRWIHLRLPQIPLASSPTTSSTLATVFDEYDSSQTVEVSANPAGNNNVSLGKTRLPTNVPAGRYEPTVDAVEDSAKDASESCPIFSSHVPSWSKGLGFARLGTEDFVALQELHQVIKDRVNRKTSESNDRESLSSDLDWASWSGSAEDPRKRAFGFLPGTWVSPYV